MFERILVATDGSENAMNAVRHAAAIGRMAGAEEVLVMHVCTACTADLDPDEKNLEAANAIVRDAGKVITESGLSARTVVETSYPPESVGNAIIDTARGNGTGLIVLGSRGLTEFKGMMLGSVSNKVVHGAACPVLVVKSGC
jgi:nucleotide-binding universal stress UspA family protein